MTGARVETFLVNWRATDERMLLREAMIGTVALKDGRFVAELESPMRHLDRPNGRYLRRHCDAELGDARCGVDLGKAAFRAGGWRSGGVAPGRSPGGDRARRVRGRLVRAGCDDLDFRRAGRPAKAG